MLRELNPFSLLIILSYLLSYLFCQSNNEEITKLMSCMNIISQNTGGQPSDIQKYLLKCFITITDVEAKEVLVGMEQGIESIDQEEIKKLTDISTLNDIPKNELNEYSTKLTNTIKSFKKMQEKYKSEEKDEEKEYYTDDEEYKKAHPSRGNSLGSFMKKMTGLLKTINNIGNFVIAIIFIYFGYIILKNCRKNNSNKKRYKETNKENKDKSKNKKKNKKNE